MRETALPPTHDAEWCIHQLMQYMEMGVPNRLAFKTGRARALELNNLSNIGANAALSHRSKARAPLLPPSQTQRWAHSLPVTVRVDVRPLLRDVFVHYCRHAQKDNYLSMSRTQLLRFARECGLSGAAGGALDAPTLEIIFQHVYRESPDQVPGVRLGLADWLRVLLCCALLIQPGMEPQDAFDAVVHDHVLAHGPAAASARQPDALSGIVMSDGVQDALEAWEDPLLRVYDFYVNEQELVSMGRCGGKLSWDDIVNAKNSLPLGSFLRLAQDFELVPRLLTCGSLADAFRRACVGPSATELLTSDDPSAAGDDHAVAEMQSGLDLSRLGFDQFIEAVARVALVAYNYQPQPDEEHTQHFTGTYCAPAKMLWLDDAKASLAESIRFPNTVPMPGAAFSSAIGLDDTPHTNPTASRCASRLLNSRCAPSARLAGQARVTLGQHAEVMAVHDTAAASPGRPHSVGPSSAGAQQRALGNAAYQQRPLHLAKFTASWVGRPPTPTYEQDRLQPQRRAASAHLAATGTGRLGARAVCVAPGTLGAAAAASAARTAGGALEGVDSEGAVCMANMVRARDAADAAAAALKMRFQSAQRQQSRRALEGAKAWRAELQAAAGQSLSASDMERIASAAAAEPPPAADAAHEQAAFMVGGGSGIPRTRGSSAPASRQPGRLPRVGGLSHSGASHSNGDAGVGRAKHSGTLVSELNAILAGTTQNR